MPHYRPPSSPDRQTNPISPTNSTSMPIFGEKPYTSITVKINQLCKPNRNEDLEDDAIELQLSDLISLIKVQPGPGPSEAARAIRKNIKYGSSIDTQLNALHLLELLVLNSGRKIGPVLASDEKLIDLLKGIITGSANSGTGGKYDKRVQTMTKNLAIGWRSELRDLEGYKLMANLYQASGGKRSDGKGRGHRRTTSAFGDENVLATPEGRSDSDDDRRSDSPRYSRTARSSPRPAKKSPPPRPAVRSPYAASGRQEEKPKKKKEKKLRSKKRSKRGIVYADEQYKIPRINYKVEAPKIRKVLADCHTHTTALSNALLYLPAGTDPLDDKKASDEFEKCRKIRRRVLQYLQFVGAGDESTKTKETIEMEDEFLGSLIMANEQLVESFKKFDKASGFTEENPGPHHYDRPSDSESDESYYSSDSEEDEEDEEPGEASIEQRLASAHITEGSSSRLQEKLRSPPPVPRKPAKKEPEPEKPALQRVATDATGASIASGDPFGDTNEVESIR